MDKYLYKKRYALFQDVLIRECISKGITQEELAKRLGRPQSYVAKVEGGSRNMKIRLENEMVTKWRRYKESKTRRIDPIELLEYCYAIDLTLTEFAAKVEGRLYAEGKLPDFFSQKKKSKI